MGKTDTLHTDEQDLNDKSASHKKQQKTEAMDNVIKQLRSETLVTKVPC